MSARFYVLAAVMVASLVSAANTTPFNGCPSESGNTALYANTSSGCSAVVTCTSKYTTCLGSTKNCTKAGECISEYLSCINTAVDSTGCSTVLADLKLSLLSVTNGQLFNASNAYQSCQARGCALLNATYNGEGANCSTDLTALCVSPVNFVATLLLQGQFTAILNDPTKRAKFLNALVDDLFRILRIVGIVIRRSYIAGSKRQALQTLVVEVQVPGVSASNTAFSAAFTNLKNSGSSWASSANAVYQAETGGTLKVLGVGTGGASTAFSSIPVPTTAAPTSAPTTKTPPTPAPTTKTPSNGTNSPPSGNSTTAKPSVNTPAPPTPSTTKSPTTKSPTAGSSSSGAGARSLLVAAAIAVMSAAFLF